MMKGMGRLTGRVGWAVVAIIWLAGCGNAQTASPTPAADSRDAEPTARPTAQPTARPTIRPTARPTVPPEAAVDSAVLSELDFGVGGGGPPGLCDTDGRWEGPLTTSGEPIIAVGSLDDGEYYRDGAVIPYEMYGNADYTAYFWPRGAPHLCVSDPAYAANLEVISPFGTAYPVVPVPEDLNETGVILLPPDAYVFGGMWDVVLHDLGQFPELGADSFHVTYDIQPAWSEIRVGVWPDGLLIAVGFDENEPVVALLATPRGELIDHIDLEADENGFIVFDKGGDDVVFVLVGAASSSHVAFDEWVSSGEEAKEPLYQRVWGGG